MLDPRHAAALVLAGHEPALPVDRVAVVVARGLQKGRHRAVRLVEAHHAVVRDVGPDQVAAGREIGGALGPSPAGPQLLQVDVAEHQALEARVADVQALGVHGSLPLRPCARFSAAVCPE